MPDVLEFAIHNCGCKTNNAISFRFGPLPSEFNPSYSIQKEIEIEVSNGSQYRYMYKWLDKVIFLRDKHSRAPTTPRNKNTIA